MARLAACRTWRGVSKSGSPTTRLTIDRPSRRSWLARSAAEVLGDGLILRTRSAARVVLVVGMGANYRRAERVAKTSSVWLDSVRLWIGLTLGSAGAWGSRYEPEAPAVFREDRRHRQPDASGGHPPRRAAGLEPAARDAGGRGSPAIAAADEARRDADGGRQGPVPARAADPAPMRAGQGRHGRCGRRALGRCVGRARARHGCGGGRRAAPARRPHAGPR